MLIRAIYSFRLQLNAARHFGPISPSSWLAYVAIDETLFYQCRRASYQVSEATISPKHVT